LHEADFFLSNAPKELYSVSEKNKITVVIPSRMGYEKKAMEKAAEVAREMGFSEDRINDLKTAVAEACINAMEHGNDLDDRTCIGITLTPGSSTLEVSISDDGSGVKDVPTPSIQEKMEGHDPSKRGWGVFLIKSLMDDVQFLSDQGGGNTVRMVIHLEQNSC
jgi:serine/threonine-protein kinase RsbW